MALDSREAMMFEIGQRVLCIDDGWVLFLDGVPADPQPPATRPTPKRGSIYEVASLGWIRVGNEARRAIAITEFGDEWWQETNFVPLKKTETDISVFTAMQNKYPAGRPVKATPVPVTPSDIAHAIRNRQLRRLLDQLERRLSSPD